MARLINKNFAALCNSSAAGIRGVVLEGGSRSGKTYSTIHFLIKVCAEAEEPLTINIIKETYNSFKTTLYDDFNAILPKIGQLSPFMHARDVPSFRLLGSKINFLGADQPSKFHGAGCDYFWINEGLDVQQAIFDQLEMRCRAMWIIDYNPKVSDHWVYNRLEKRDNVRFVHSTALDNPFIGKWERVKIMGYEPTPANIAAGTADDYMWKVYGQGLRASMQGLVYPSVTWIDSFPANIERVAYGMDFGYTNSPTAIVRVGKEGQDIYVQKLFYAPTDNASALAEAIKQIDISDGHLWADSADPGMISDLRLKGIKVFAVNKFPGSIKYGIDLIKQHRLHAVRDADLGRELNNYKWREVGGVRLNEPIDDFNHALDAARYAVLSEFRR